MPTARDWRSRSRFQVSLLRPLGSLRRRCSSCCVRRIRSLCRTTTARSRLRATLAGLSWTLPVPSTLSLRLIESSRPAVSSSVLFGISSSVYSLPVLWRYLTGVSSPGRPHAVHIFPRPSGRGRLLNCQIGDGTNGREHDRDTPSTA